MKSRWTPPLRRSTPYWGGKVTRIDNPVIWYDGTTGESSAYVIDVGDYNVVILSVGNFKTTVKSVTNIGKLPASLIPLSDIHLRMAFSETALLVEWSGKGDLCMWGTFANPSVGQYTTGWYLAKK